eukprot:c8770_g1_i2.p2 GENE.c8770_g1_i2~~c8770_g1_i2.p2  ORF type:complete len:123 (+),score=23.77 c8770_g1_i2:271-639(+)
MFLDPRKVNLAFKYGNLLGGMLVVVCEVLSVLQAFSIRQFVTFFGILFITSLFILVNVIANEWIQRYFGFLYLWEGRGCLLIFLGCTILGSAPLFLIGGVYCITVGSLELLVSLCFRNSTGQ